MLEFYFKYPGVLLRMRRGPLAGDIDDLAAELARVGYTRATARRYLSLVAKFSRYAERRGLARSSILDGTLLEERSCRISRGKTSSSSSGASARHASPTPLGRRLSRMCGRCCVISTGKACSQTILHGSCRGCPSGGWRRCRGIWRGATSAR